MATKRPVRQTCRLWAKPFLIRPRVTTERMGKRLTIALAIFALVAVLVGTYSGYFWPLITLYWSNSPMAAEAIVSNATTTSSTW